MREVYQFQVISNLDADSVACLGDDFVWALVLRMERWFNRIDLHIDPAEIGNRFGLRWCSWRTERETGLHLLEGVEEILAGVLR